MTTPKPTDDILPSWLQLQSKLGKLNQDVTAFNNVLDQHEDVLRDLTKGFAAIEERLKRLEKTTAPTDPYEAEIASAIAAKAVETTCKEKARLAAEYIVRNLFAHPDSTNAIARIIDDVYSGKGGDK